MDSYRFSGSSLDKLSATFKSFLSLDANGKEDELFRKKLAYPYEEGKTIESFFEPLKTGGEDYFSTSKQMYLDSHEIKRTKAMFVKT